MCQQAKAVEKLYNTLSALYLFPPVFMWHLLNQCITSDICCGKKYYWGGCTVWTLSVGNAMHPVWGYKRVDGIFTCVLFGPGEITSDLLGHPFSLLEQRKAKPQLGSSLHHYQNLYRKIDIWCHLAFAKRKERLAAFRCEHRYIVAALSWKWGNTLAHQVPAEL